AIEHRLMHAETLAYMFHWLSYEMKLGKDIVAPSLRRLPSSSEPRFLPAGYATLGQQTNGAASFGWDNEFQTHSVFVPEFSMDTFNVTNADFLKFIRSGGYSDRPLWSAEAWQWIQQAGIHYPKFWIPRGEEWFYRTMFEEVP